MKQCKNTVRRTRLHIETSKIKTKLHGSNSETQALEKKQRREELPGKENCWVRRKRGFYKIKKKIAKA